MTIKIIRQASGMTQKEFASYFAIPRRTIEDWETGKRNCSSYLLSLIEYKLIKEGLVKYNPES